MAFWSWAIWNSNPVLWPWNFRKAGQLRGQGHHWIWELNLTLPFKAWTQAGDHICKGYVRQQLRVFLQNEMLSQDLLSCGPHCVIWKSWLHCWKVFRMFQLGTAWSMIYIHREREAFDISGILTIIKSSTLSSEMLLKREGNLLKLS